ncbi:hypothetical protein G4Y79_07955 [Phototrophicus methaneseepsis]|uniref:Uncharacterized protein n=1 Tax=Phototrophicus methaneseepsis TaxID=2710758 RepID=A0A7S8ECA6_9CHLR|nr:hypothetical protein [Phototrophicus methaneseepsis]QPC84296.1 hypothetical protein G4Y79_07955 [Phototrophicus methaneseepsis]
MWRKALIATVILFIFSIAMNLITQSIILTAYENEALLESLNMTIGTFIATASWVSRILNLGITFLVIWWALRSTTPPRKQKRAYDAVYDDLRAQQMRNEPQYEAQYEDEAMQYSGKLSEEPYQAEYQPAEHLAEVAHENRPSQIKKGT